MQNAEASVWSTCQAQSPTLVFLAPKQSPQALQSGGVESGVGRWVGKTRGLRGREEDRQEPEKKPE